MNAVRLLVTLTALCSFTSTSLADTIVQFDTSLGSFQVELFNSVAPDTVANFLNYVESGAYDETIIHRSVPNFLIQGGGYNTVGNPIPTNAPIPLEYDLPNTIGTIAMARTSNPNSATSQWFINTADNTQSLGPSHGGGYAVFGQVLGDGMNVVDAIAALPNFAFQSPFNNLPLQNFTQMDYNNQVKVQTSNLVVVSRVSVVPEASTLLLTALGLSAFAYPCLKRFQRGVK